MNSALSKTSAVRIWPLVPSGLTLSRTLEFLCLGGASLLVMAFCCCLYDVHFIMRDDVRLLLAEVFAGTLLVTALLSWPHTMWSYRFAYSQGFSFVLKHAWELLGYPLLIVLLLCLCAYSWAIPVKDLSFVAAFEKAAAALSVNLQWSHYDSAGELMLSLLLVLQIIMSGYHYGMQAMGVALACGERRGYKLALDQKKILLLNVYALWFLNLLSGYTFLSLLDSRNFGYKPIRFPAEWQAVAATIFALSLILLILKVVLPIYKENRSLPPLSSGVSMVSLWLWLQPFFQPFGFQVSVVPLAHGLQYLYFAGRGEAAGFDQQVNKVVKENKILRGLWLVLLFAVLSGLGFFAYRYLPSQLDNTALVKNLSPNFFLLAAYIFLNTHHYMIDSVVWRGDSRLRSYMPTMTCG